MNKWCKLHVFSYLIATTSCDGWCCLILWNGKRDSQQRLLIHAQHCWQAHVFLIIPGCLKEGESGPSTPLLVVSNERVIPQWCHRITQHINNPLAQQALTNHQTCMNNNTTLFILFSLHSHQKKSIIHLHTRAISHGTTLVVGGTQSIKMKLTWSPREHAMSTWTA